MLCMTSMTKQVLCLLWMEFHLQQPILRLLALQAALTEASACLWQVLIVRSTHTMLLHIMFYLVGCQCTAC
ncbi:hypothetical protein COO60DRAFT_1533204 [Scenedesmus sp. NREL 46B-D3]|nr:hypothetical protein COO60DRAFT_1533204 [Scenedesmus sp. NREL 46B-D3]